MKTYKICEINYNIYYMKKYMECNENDYKKKQAIFYQKVLFLTIQSDATYFLNKDKLKFLSSIGEK